MRRRADVIIQILTLLVLWVLPLFAQAPKPPSLKEQLEAQYQQPGTVLVIQKAGILGIPSASKATCATRYQGGKLTPDASCTASKPLTVGERVYLSKIEVDVAEGKISVRIAECDSCNKVKFSSCKSQIDFQFDKGYLEKASVSEVKGTISKVLSFDQGADQQSAQAPKPPSLKEQLEAQYPPGTVLAIQKEGIPGVPANSKTPCATKYQGGKLTSDASCTASKPLTVGEKVNLLKIEVDEAKGRISFRIAECDSCNKVEFSSRTSQIDFQFAKDASVSAVEGTIDEVLTIHEGEAQQVQLGQHTQAQQASAQTAVPVPAQTTQNQPPAPQIPAPPPPQPSVQTAAPVPAQTPAHAPAPAPPSPSLEEQLKAQYKLVKVSSDGRILEQGTVLAIQKEKILGVQPSSILVCPNKYQDGSLKPASGVCKVMVANTSRDLAMGEKVYPWKLEVDIRKEKITVRIIECDSCNGTEPSLYKSDVVFQFAKGYLESASVSQVEDVIGQVLTIDESANQQPPQPQDQQAREDQSGGTPPTPPCTVEKGQSPEQVAECFGQPEKIVKVDPKQIYVYKDLKVTFLNGKVSEVQ